VTEPDSTGAAPAASSPPAAPAGSAGTAVVTGASSGIGAATARALAGVGYSVVLGARRVEAVEALAAELGPPARAFPLDVTVPASVARFCGEVSECRLLVNNAGGALGLDPIAEADEAKWQQMYDANVMGTLRMTKALLPRLIASGDGFVLNVGSVAAFEPYVGGSGYNAAKAAVRAFSDVLRMELLGKPVRVSEIDPGMVQTDFSLVRFDGDTARADAVYQGVTPLTAEDIADCIRFIVTRPSHVDIDQLVIRPRAQARVHLVHRSST
jgi:NADP-dependent 3-hydroxy acid dehydrogenase YdfG